MTAGLLPRLLLPGPAGLADHTARYGPPPAVPGRRQRDALIAEVARAGLTGRGGAGFPAGTPAEPGSMLVTVFGAVREPGVREAW